VRHVLFAPAVAGVSGSTVTIGVAIALAPAPRTVGMGKSAASGALVPAGAVAPSSFARQTPA
jgi:hypothetical protein